MEQKKNKIVAAIVTILILIIIVLGLVYLNRQSSSNDNNELGTTGAFPENTQNNNNSENTENTGEYVQNTPQKDNKKPILKKIAEGPIAGAVSFLGDDVEMVRYVEKETGAIKEIDMNSDNTTQLSKRTIKKIHDAYFEGTGDKVIIRHIKKIDGLDIIKTYWTNAEDINEGGFDQVGNFFPDGIREIKVSGDGTKVIYLCDNNCDDRAKDGVFGIKSNFDNTGGEQLFYTPLKQWLLQWTTNSVFLTTKPSNNVDGYSYLYNEQNEKLEKIKGKIPGLTTSYSKNGQRVIFAESGSSFKASIFDQYENAEKELSLNVIPEKCVWGNVETSTTYCAVPTNFKSKDFPDKWYKGMINFSDNIWIINTDSIGRTDLSLKLKEEAREDIDAVSLFLGNNDTYLYFTNKIDGSLWVYRMVQ